MANLSTKTTKVNGILTLKGFDAERLKETQEKLCKCLSALSDQYACIIHDRDFTDDGISKTPHIHFVAELKHATRLSTTLNSVSSQVGVDPLSISIEKYSSFEGSLQYLVHQNNPEKTQYKRDEIKTNIGKEDLSNYLDMTTTAFDIDLWISIIKLASSIDEVIKRIGIHYYNMYRNTICDLFRQFHKGELYGVFKPYFDVSDQF